MSNLTASRSGVPPPVVVVVPCPGIAVVAPRVLRPASVVAIVAPVAAAVVAPIAAVVTSIAAVAAAAVAASCCAASGYVTSACGTTHNDGSCRCCFLSHLIISRIVIKFRLRVRAVR